MPTPIILCGRSPAVGKPVAEAMKPDFEVVAFISDVETARANIPALLSGSQSPPSLKDKELSTFNFSQPPKAIVFGGAFTDEMIEQIHEVCVDVKPGVPWLTRGPNAAERFPNPENVPAKYGEAAGKSIRDTLIKLDKEGKMVGDSRQFW